MVRARESCPQNIPIDGDSCAAGVSIHVVSPPRFLRRPGGVATSRNLVHLLRAGRCACAVTIDDGDRMVNGRQDEVRHDNFAVLADDGGGEHGHARNKTIFERHGEVDRHLRCRAIGERKVRLRASVNERCLELVRNREHFFRAPAQEAYAAEGIRCRKVSAH
jgi:hypothetical protein